MVPAWEVAALPELESKRIERKLVPFMVCLEVTEHHLGYISLISQAPIWPGLKRRRHRPFLSMGEVSEFADIFKNCHSEGCRVGDKGGW